MFLKFYIQCFIHIYILTYFLKFYIQCFYTYLHFNLKK
jgi:hypothetical protein